MIRRFPRRLRFFINPNYSITQVFFPSFLREFQVKVFQGIRPTNPFAGVYRRAIPVIIVRELARRIYAGGLLLQQAMRGDLPIGNFRFLRRLISAYDNNQDLRRSKTFVTNVILIPSNQGPIRQTFRRRTIIRRRNLIISTFRRPRASIIFCRYTTNLRAFFLPRTIFLVRVVINVRRRFCPAFRYFLGRKRRIITFGNTSKRRKQRCRRFPTNNLGNLARSIHVDLGNKRATSYNQLAKRIRQLTRRKFLILMRGIKKSFTLLAIRRPLNRITQQNISIKVRSIRITRRRRIMLHAQRNRVRRVMLSTYFRGMKDIFK